MTLGLTKRQQDFAFSICVALVAGLGCWSLFSSLVPSVLVGDDLANYYAYQAGKFANPENFLTETYSNKYRPVFAVSWYLMMQLVDMNMQGVFAVNLVLQMAFSILVYLCFATSTHAPRWLCAVGAMVLGVSRFAVYQVTQFTGLVESVAGLFFLASLYVLCVAHARGFSRRKYLISLLLLILAIFCHERYLAAIPCLVVAWVYVGRSGEGFARWILALPLVAIGLANLLIKLTLGAPVLEGTGYKKISIIPEAQAARHAWEALSSLMGFQHGPEYVAGVTAYQSSFSMHWAWLGLIPLSLVALIVWGFFQKKRECKFDLNRRLEILFLLFFALIMLIPPVLTIRLEQRWLLLPQFFIVFSALIALGRIRKKQRQLAACLLGVHLILLVGSFFLYRPSLDKIYWRESGIVGMQVNDSVIPAVANFPMNQPITLIVRPDHCDWTLGSGYFFEIYSGHHRLVRCVSRISEGIDGSASSLKGIFAMSGAGKFEDLGTVRPGCAAKTGIWLSPMYDDGWMERSAEVLVSHCSERLHFDAYLPEGLDSRTLAISVDGQRVGTAVVSPGATLTLDYRIPFSETHRVRFEVDKVVNPSPGGDMRSLGVVLKNISTE